MFFSINFRTPLHAACTCNHPNIVKYLVNSGADLLAVNGDGNMPFDICEDEAILDHIESEMVKRNITQEIVDYTRASTEIKMMEDLQEYIANSGDINAKDNDGITQLHIAAANGYVSVVKYLVEHGADVDSRDCDYWTPLHGAACWGTLQHAKVIELLVQAGADINAKTLNGEAPLDICDNPEIRERLVQLKDEIETKHASTTSNLRRTQSRTNSRTHSVRRTSIREKAQISRREAREEALLRQETNPSQNNSDEDSNAIGDSNSGARLQLVNGANKENSSNYQSHHEAAAQLDQQLRRTTNDENQNNTSPPYSKKGYDDTDVLLENGGDMKNKLSLGPTNTDSESLKTAKSNTQKTNISKTTDPIRIYSNGSIDDKHDVISNQDDIETSEQMSCNQNDHLNSGFHEKIGQADEAFKPNHLVNSSNETNAPQTQSLTNQISPQSSLVFASINCTLSDLKKQRSDLRHRNMNLSLSLPESNSDPKITKNDLTHFPHQPSDVPDSANLSTKSLNNDDQSSIELDGNVIRTSHHVDNPIISNTLLVSDKSSKIDAIGIKMNNNTNSFEELDTRPVKDNNLKLTFTSTNGFPKAELPPPSPSQALRKFRGDPSEVVGGKERYRTRKCCILF